MTNEEHYFENLLFHGKDVLGEYNKRELSEDVRIAIEICANYVIYSVFSNRDDFIKHMNYKFCPPCGARMGRSDKE